MMFWRRLAYLLPWRRRAAERDMQEELKSIAEMADPNELGNLTLAAEDARAEWGWTRLEQTGQDVRYALRTLRKSPAFTLTVVLSLAVGIGANTALFTLLNTVMWKLLPVKDPEGLIVFGQQNPAWAVTGFTFQQYGAFHDQHAAVSVAAYSPVSLNVTIDGRTEPTTGGQLVSGGYFSLLGVPAGLGRLLGPDDDRVPMGHPVAVISDGYWRSRFGADPAIVGRTLALSGVPFTIVGVTPADFFGLEVGSAPRIFVPIMMQPVVMPVSANLLADRPTVYSTWLRVVGRLAPGVPMADAEVRLNAMADQPGFAPRSKRTGEIEDVRIVVTSAATGLSDLRNQFSQPLFILMGVVAIVLLVACANAGALVLARSAARRPEFALRLALGAGRARLLRQVLAEGLVLACLGGIAGAVLAQWATRALVAYASAGRGSIVLDLSPDLRVLAFTAAVSALTGLLFASVPAVRASRSDTDGAMRRDFASVRGVPGGRGSGKVLVVAQVALSLVLLVGAGLFARSLRNLHHQETALEQARVLVVRVEPRDSGRRGAPGVLTRLDRIYRDLLEQLQGLPGVEAASLARTSPLAPITFAARLKLPTNGETRVPTLMVYPRYFATLGIPIVKGRDFMEDDLRLDSARVVVVNQAFAREFLDGRDPLGDAHGLFEYASSGGDAIKGGLNIIGVVKDTRFPALREPTPPIMYQTFLQTNTGFGQMVLHVRATDDASRLVRPIREAVQAIDPDVPTFEIRTLADEVAATLVRERLVAVLSGVFGIVALALISIGLYGLLAFTVSTRTAEIGVRMALGATRSDVRWMIARQALTVALAGILVGVPTAWTIGRLASRQLSSLLFELPAWDPATIASACVVLVIVSLGAALMPARRAVRIDPIAALRTD